MLKNPSLITRMGIGKAVGIIIGLISFFSLPYIWPAAPDMTRWGILLWYTTLGVIIGVFGVVTWHPILNLPLPWWVRAPLIGGWMNFILVFFAYEMMQAMLIAVMGRESILTSPFWFVLEGAIIGLLMGYLTTKFGGEGKAAADAVNP